MINKENLFISPLNRLLTTLLLSVIIFFIYKDLDLLDPYSMFIFHDVTQFVRVEQYTDALWRGEIPPIYAKDMNFGSGYPIFMYYAPIAYIIGSIYKSLGINVVQAIKMTFASFVICGAIGMFLWIRVKSDNHKMIVPALCAVLYVCSPWWASEIFVRGNMASASFLAFAPLALWGIHKFGRYPILSAFFIMVATLSHNALSLLFILILLVYSASLDRKSKIKRVLFTMLSIGLSSWFWIPSLTQFHLTYASQVANLIKYSDHFLCLWQIWTSNFWGYGGSMPGCADGMSFMLGKIITIFSLGGIVISLINYRQIKKIVFLEIALLCGSVFLSLPISTSLWEILTPLQSAQFPWRLLAIALIFAIVIASYSIHFILKILCLICEKIGLPAHLIAVSTFIFILCLITLTSQKYFVANKLKSSEVISQYASRDYTVNTSVFEVPEYLPRSVDRQWWLSIRNRQITESELIQLKSQMEGYRPDHRLRYFGGIISAVVFALIIWQYRIKKIP
jgi:hypothetical protein